MRFLLFFLAACGQTILEDPMLESAGLALGGNTVLLMSSPPDATDEELTQRMSSVGAQLFVLVYGHADWSGGKSRIPPEAEIPVELSDDQIGITWDGRELLAGLRDPAHLAGDAAIDLVYEPERSESGNLDHPPCPGAEMSGTDTVRCPPTIQRDAAWTVTDEDGNVLTVRASFGITLDGDNCAAGGEIRAQYAGNGPDRILGGEIWVNYSGCGRARIMTWLD